MDRPFDVFGVGNAIVDMLAFVPESFIEQQQLDRGSMTLMDTVRQADILRHLADHKVELASGGSAANTMVAIAQSGGSGVYCGKVAHDTHGEFYQQDMEQAGIKFEVEMAPEAAEPTGTCVVLTTPDTERTMCTHLGISTSLHKNDLDTERLAQCKYSYIEGYLWDAEGPRETCIEVFEQSKRLGVARAFTISDPFLVDRYHQQFRDMIPEYCDVLFCNADEARQLCETDSLEDCQRRLTEMCDLVFLTDSEKGCYVLSDNDATHVPAFQIVALDSVGAGDAFAGGVLYGLTHGMGVLQAARWGNYLAARVVEITGPRLHGSMSEKVDEIVVV